MPPLRQLPAEITLLTDEELEEQLMKYNFTPGPILPSTRSVYERKLFTLRTGQEPLPSSRYEPVNDDDDDDDQEADDSGDEEIVLHPQQARQRMTRSTRTELRKTPPHQPVSAPRERFSAADRLHSPRSGLPHKESSKASKGGLPLWVKLLAVLLVALLVFLVVKNLESDPASQGPDIPEINV